MQEFGYGGASRGLIKGSKATQQSATGRKGLQPVVRALRVLVQEQKPPANPGVG